MTYFSHIRAGLIASALLLTTALASPAMAESLPEISPRQIASDVEVKYNPETGVREYIAPSFDPFEEDPYLAGTTSLRSTSNVTTIDGQSLRGGALLDLTFYYNSESNDPYDTRGYNEAAYLSGEYAPVTRRDSRILECNEQVQDVVYYHEDYYRPSLYGNLYRPYRHYRGHHGFSRGFGYDYGHSFRSHGGFRGFRGFRGFNGGRGFRRGDNIDRRRLRNRRDIRDREERRANREERRREREGRRNDREDRHSNRDDRQSDREGRRANREERRANREGRRGNRIERDRNRDLFSDRRRRFGTYAGPAGRRSATPRLGNATPRLGNATPRLDSNETQRERRIDRAERSVTPRRNERIVREPRRGDRPRAERTPRSRNNNVARPNVGRAAPRAATPRPAHSRPAATPAPRRDRAASTPRRQSNNRSRPARAERAPNRARDIKSRNAPRRFGGGKGNSKLRLMGFLPMASAWSRNAVRTVDVQCAREDVLTVHIPQERLNAARFDGLTVLVLDRTGAEIPVFVPPNYVEGYRQAVSEGVTPSTSYQAPQVSPRPQLPRVQNSAPCPVGTAKQNDGTCLQGAVETYSGYPVR